MIGYVTLGTNDLATAAKFYDELFAEIGIGRMMEDEAFIAWGSGMDKTALSITLPHDKQPATVGNGTMVAISVDSPEKVNALHAKALQLGGQDEGAAGPRSSGFYAGYFRDPDGNKLNAFCILGE